MRRDWLIVWTLTIVFSTSVACTAKKENYVPKQDVNTMDQVVTASRATLFDDIFVGLPQSKAEIDIFFKDVKRETKKASEMSSRSGYESELVIVGQSFTVLYWIKAKEYQLQYVETKGHELHDQFSKYIGMDLNKVEEKWGKPDIVVAGQVTYSNKTLFITLHSSNDRIESIEYGKEL